MLSIPAPLIGAVVRGDKTAHRRPVGQAQLIRRGQAARHRTAHARRYRSEPWSPVVGDVVALRRVERRDARTVHAVTGWRVRIVSADRTPLALPSLDEARAEGFPSVELWAAWWVSSFDSLWRRALQRDPYWQPGPECAVRAVERRHVGRAVWLVRFELDRSEPLRSLAPEAGGFDPDARDDARGYCFSPSLVLDAGDAVDDVTLEAFARDNRRRFDSRRAEVRRDAATERFERAVRQARARGIDVGEQVRAVERMATALERRAEDVA